MQWKRVVSDVTGVRIGAVLEQEPEDVGVLYSYVQRGGAIVTLVNETWLLGQGLTQRRNVTGGTRLEKSFNSQCRCHGRRL